MENIIKVLFGSLKYRTKLDYIFIPLKCIYIIYSLPLLALAFLLYLRSSGAFGSPKNEKFGIIKKILFHLSNIFFSFVFWGLIINALKY